MQHTPDDAQPARTDSRVFQPPRKRLGPEDATHFIEGICVPMHCLSLGGRVLWANEAELNLLGYTWEEYAGHHISEFHTDQEKVDEILQRLAAGEELKDFECRLRCSDGSTIHVALSANGLWRGDKLVHSRGVMREISRQRRLENELRDRAYQLERTLTHNETLLAQLNGLLDASPVGVAFLDHRLRYQRVNAAMASFHGTPMEAHKGLKPSEVLKQGGEALEELFAEAQRTGKPCLKRIDTAEWGDEAHRHLVCSFFPVVAQDGERIGIGKIAVDVTERVQTQEALRQTQQRLHKVVHHAPLFMWAVDKQGKFLFAEGAGMAALGLKSGDLDGVSAFERFGHLPEIDALKRALRGESGNVTPKVGDAWFDVTLMPTLAEDGEVTGAFGVAVDVTARMQAKLRQRELEGEVSQARRRESLRVMAGGIGHDLNNLLTAIMGNVNLGLLRLPGSAAARFNLEQIAIAAQHATELTREMLACAGKSPPQLAPLDLNRFVDSLGGLMDISLGGRVMVRQEFSPMLPAIMGDSGQLGRVVMSLIRNAADAIGDKDGTIDLATGVVELAPEDLHSCKGGEKLAPGTFVYIEISDDGCGMDQEVLHHLFDPFYSTKRNGSGLSLAAALGIMVAHGGAIGVESAPGRGSSFKLYFPPSTAAVAERTPAPPVFQTNPEVGGKVLVVDDSEAVRQVAKMMLEDLGFSVMLAENGAAALDLFREHYSNLALVILDMTMPGLSGEETLQLMLKIDAGARVVISSGYSEREVAARLAAQKVAGFLPKPYSPALMREMLATALPAAK